MMRRGIWGPDRLALMGSAGIAASGGSPLDAAYADVQALLHFDGSNGGTTFTDEKGHSFTATGGAPVTSTAQKKFGAASLLLGANSHQVTSGATTDFGFEQLFTIEMWIRPDAVATTQAIWTLAGAGTPAYCYGFISSGSKLIFSRGAGPITSSANISAAAWTHVAWSRDGSNVIRQFINGVIDGTTTKSDTSLTAKYWRFGQDVNTAGNAMLGYIDDARLTLGVCRYTANFTPPTKAFADA